MMPPGPAQVATSRTGAPLATSLQLTVPIDCVSPGHAYPEEARDVNFNPCGQIIGAATTVRRT